MVTAPPPALGRFVLVATVGIGTLAFIDARDSGASVAEAVFMVAWACFPTALAARLCARTDRSRPGWTLLTYAVVTILGGVAVFGSLAVAGPPDPNTARHLAPFLWPLILFFAGVCLAALVWTVGRLSRKFEI